MSTKFSTQNTQLKQKLEELQSNISHKDDVINTQQQQLQILQEENNDYKEQVGFYFIFSSLQNVFDILFLLIGIRTVYALISERSS